MDDNMDIPEDSMRHIEALLARHRPEMIQRMFQQAMESRRSSVASSFTASSISTASTGSSFRSSAHPSFRTSTTSSYHSRLSVASNLSNLSTSTLASDMAPSIASSTSSRSRAPSRRAEPRSYPSLDPTRPVPSVLTPTSEISSPLDTKQEPGFTPTDEDMSIASFPTDKSQSQAGDSYMFCTYCAEGKTLKTFKAKSDWKKHEMRMHETGEDWPCIVNGCNRIFDRQKDFLKHHQRYHSGRPLPSLTDIGITLLPRRVFGCGFDKCKEVSIGWDERCDHVAKHMKNGCTFEQWKYSTVIRNLIRQEALNETWKEMIACLDEWLRESRSHISWCPDNTRILRQKLQCCDLRPSREEVLITALSLRSDITLDPSYQQLPPGFVVPSRDSVPNVANITREQRMHILIGNPNASLSRSRLAAINAALLQASNAMTPGGRSFDCSASPFDDSPTVDSAGRRISFMDLDTTGDYLDLSQPAIPDMLPTPAPQSTMESEQPPHPSFLDPTKPSNPLGWCYPNYFDAAPQFEESPYYDRPSLGQMISKPLQKIGSRLNRTSSAASRPNSQVDQQVEQADMSPNFPIQSPVQTMSMRHQQTPQQQQHQPPLSHPQPHHPPQHQYRNMDIHHQSQHDQLHLFTSQS